MIKKNLKTLILTSVIILLPILLGLLFWNKLPNEIPTHWNAAGEIDQYSSKSFAVFFIPLFLLAIHWLCTFVTNSDKKNANQNRQPMTMVLWICPILSVLLFGLIYAAAMGMNIDITTVMPLIMGAIFVVIGNYLPKCRQNYTIGIKLPWTMHDEENWNRTHRMAGKLWVGVGVLAMFSTLLPSKSIFIVFMLILSVAVIVPTVYSYLLFKNKEKSGE